jgi:hypothetical protein
MADKTLFASLRDAMIPQADTLNSENAPAYALTPKQALAQYAAGSRVLRRWQFNKGPNAGGITS